MNDTEPLSDDLKKLARDAALLNQQIAADPLEVMLAGIRAVPDQLQMMVDNIVAMQKSWPMPEEGWQRFQRDLEHTNQKHDLNLIIKPELLEDE